MAHATGYEPPVQRLERMPRGAMAASLVLVVAGIAVLIAALASDAERAWRAYMVNWLYFVSIAQGAVMLAVVVTITKGLWSRPVRRFALSFVAFLPLAWLLMLPILFGAEHIFPWIEHPVAGKEAYLNVPFLTVRNLVAFALLVVLSLVFAYWALRPDLGALRDRQDGRLRALYERFTGNWRGQEAEELLAHKRIAVLAPIVCLAYALAMTFFAFDMVMSLEPHWFSTLIGPYFFMAAFLGGIAATTLLTIWYSRTLGEGPILPQQFHDLGKLVFAFCVFWAYLFFSQFIVIWYGNLPHEQAFVVHRLGTPYKTIAQIVFACLFVLPFFGLLGVAPKRRPAILGIFAGIVLVGLWLERYLLVYPSLYTDVERVPLGWMEIGLALPFAGILLASLMWFGTRFPMYQLWQPAGELELEGVPVTVSN